MAAVEPRGSVGDAARLMAENGTTHLVVDPNRREPVGVISSLDVAAALGRTHA